MDVIEGRRLGTPPKSARLLGILCSGHILASKPSAKCPREGVLLKMVNKASNAEVSVFIRSQASGNGGIGKLERKAEAEPLSASAIKMTHDCDIKHTYSYKNDTEGSTY